MTLATRQAVLAKQYLYWNCETLYHAKQLLVSNATQYPPGSCTSHAWWHCDIHKLASGVQHDWSQSI